jgi:hypothetical protein
MQIPMLISNSVGHLDIGPCLARRLSFCESSKITRSWSIFAFFAALKAVSRNCRVVTIALASESESWKASSSTGIRWIDWSYCTSSKECSVNDCRIVNIIRLKNSQHLALLSVPLITQSFTKSYCCCPDFCKRCIVVKSLRLCRSLVNVSRRKS